MEIAVDCHPSFQPIAFLMEKTGDDMHPFHSYACRTYQRQDRAPELPCLQY
jgi:hypothetical protein